MQKQKQSSVYKAARRFAKFGADHHFFQALRDLAAFLTLVGTALGYLLLFVYCSSYRVPFFDAASDIGLYVAILTVIGVFSLAVLGGVFTYPLMIKRQDDFAGRLKALQRCQKMSSFRGKKPPSYHWVNMSRSYTLIAFGMIIGLMIFAYFLREDFIEYSGGLLFLAIIMFMFLIWALCYLVFSGVLRLNNNPYSDRWLHRENAMYPVVVLNVYGMGILATLMIFSFSFIQQIYPVFGGPDGNRFVEVMLLVIGLSVSVMVILIVMRFFDSNPVIVFCSVTFMIAFLLSFYSPGLSQISRQMMALTGKGGDIPVRLLVNKKVACGIGPDSIFKSVDWETVDCSKTPKKEDVLVYSDVVYLALRTADAAYVRSEKGKSPLFSIKFPADGVMEYGASVKTVNDVQEEGEANDAPDNS